MEYNSIEKDNGVLDLNKAIEISSYPQYSKDFIKAFLLDNYSNNDIAQVFMVTDNEKKIFVIDYSLKVQFNDKKINVGVLVYLPTLFPNYHPEFYLKGYNNIGLNKYYINDKINEKDLRINLNFIGKYNPIKNNISELIYNLLIYFNLYFPIFKDMNNNKYGKESKLKCYLDKTKTITINFQKSEENKSYISAINELTIKLNEEIRKNEKLIEENNNLKNKINYFNDKIEIYEEKIKLLQNELNNIKNELQKYENNSNVNGGITSIKPGETVISINFVSVGIQDIGNYSLICKNTDMFVRLEERLYNDFPQFKNSETYFELKTKRIKRFKTLDENNIKNNDIINVFIIDN